MAEGTFWGRVWQVLRATGLFFAHNVLAPIVAILIVIGAILLVSMGFKGLQIGGLLGKLFGKTPSDQPSIHLANTIPPDRVDAKGNLIPVGTPDSKGITQAQVVPIADPGLFSDPSTVTFTPPGADKPVVIQLPDGVKADDVDKVVIIKPGVTAVTVKDSSGLSTERIDDLLQKYGS